MDKRRIEKAIAAPQTDAADARQLGMDFDQVFAANAGF
jgi:hypothetical protein